jgi:hypothetical protein
MSVFKYHAFIYFMRPPSWYGTLRVQFRAINWINRYAMQHHAKLSTYSEYSPADSCESVPWIDLQIQPTNRDVAKYMKTNIGTICVNMTFHSPCIIYGASKWNSKLVQCLFLKHCQKPSSVIVSTFMYICKRSIKTCAINNMYEAGFSMINSFIIYKFIDKVF